MLLAALLAAATPVWEAERAFAARAQREGQWAAFRATAAPDAVMFNPGMVRTHALLAGAKEPPRGSLMWWPARALTACDGSLAFYTGPWATPGGGHGTFSTVWRRQADGGWKWLYDSGRETPGRAAAGRAVVAARPTCRNLPILPAAPAIEEPGPVSLRILADHARPDLLVQEDGRDAASMARYVSVARGERLIGGRSDDGSLLWQVHAITDAKPGAHLLQLWAWDGNSYRLAVMDVTGAG